MLATQQLLVKRHQVSLQHTTQYCTVCTPSPIEDVWPRRALSDDAIRPSVNLSDIRPSIRLSHVPVKEKRCVLGV